MLVKLLRNALVVAMGFSGAFADDHPHIPANAWEQHPEGIALAMILTTQMENGVQKSTIQVYVKNTSNVVKSYFGPNHFDGMGVIILYVKNNESVSLRDYSPEEGSKKMRPQIKPGQILSQTVDLSPDELALIKAYPVKCHVALLKSLAHAAAL
jgi:hypothetical protein